MTVALQQKGAFQTERIQMKAGSQSEEEKVEGGIKIGAEKVTLNIYLKFTISQEPLIFFTYLT